MIKKLLILLIVLALATWMGVHLFADPGYVLFAYAKWTVEMPLWVFAILGLVLLLVGYFLLRLLHGLRVGPARWRQYRARIAMKKAQQHVGTGLQALSVGDVALAEDAFANASRVYSDNAHGFLLMAHQAYARDDAPRAGQYLQRAADYLPASSVALLLAQAKYTAGDVKNKALAAIHRLHEQNPKQKAIVQFLYEHALETGEWQTALALQGQMLRCGAFDKATFSAQQRRVYRALMQAHQARGAWQAMLALWLDMPRAHHHDVELLVAYSRALSALDKGDTAEKCLRREIKRHYSPQLVRAYVDIEGVDKAQLLATAEKWLHRHFDCADLQYALGTLCMALRLWGKARDYLERALETRIDAEVCYALGQVLEQFKEERAAMAIYRRGLMAKGLL